MDHDCTEQPISQVLTASCRCCPCCGSSTHTPRSSCSSSRPLWGTASSSSILHSGAGSALRAARDVVLRSSPCAGSRRGGYRLQSRRGADKGHRAAGANCRFARRASSCMRCQWTAVYSGKSRRAPRQLLEDVRHDGCCGRPVASHWLLSGAQGPTKWEGLGKALGTLKGFPRHHQQHRCTNSKRVKITSVQAGS